MSFPRYPKYKDSGVEWLGEVPEHWEVKRLRLLCCNDRQWEDAVRRRLTPTTNDGSASPQSVDDEVTFDDGRHRGV